MKKIISLIFTILLISGCSFESDEFANAKIYTTIYPITYLVEELYTEDATIDSIYPKDVIIDDYKLTKKQIKTYADSKLFVYSGLTNEKNIAKEFVNANDDILLIDSTYSLAIINSVEELWLSPNNYLMLAKNIKDNLNEYLENKYTIEKVNENYNRLAEELSLMDAELRASGKKAINKDNNIIVVSSDAFKFLEDYGFSVISLEDENNKSDEALKAIESNLENDRYLALINEYGETNEYINSLIKKYSPNVINMSTFYESNSEVDYLNSLKEFIYNFEILVKNIK